MSRHASLESPTVVYGIAAMAPPVRKSGLGHGSDRQLGADRLGFRPGRENLPPPALVSGARSPEAPISGDRAHVHPGTAARLLTCDTARRRGHPESASNAAGSIALRGTPARSAAPCRPRTCRR